ncbi:MAG: hypothetical protein JWP00_2613 [Chloroflexi bacterium]|nr:hypothetical protein [Chloroflexota bacterium]
MAMTVIGFYHKYNQALQTLEDLVANEYDPELVKMTYSRLKGLPAAVDYDNTLEQAPVILFKEATFGSDITEDDGFYYAECLRKGDILLTVHIPGGQSRDWEEETAKTLEDFLADGGAYDHEIRRIYGNRAGLTTYPQNRYMDPIGPNKLMKDRPYGSRSPLNGEVSNVVAVQIQTDYLAELEELSGLRMLTAAEVLAQQNPAVK